MFCQVIGLLYGAFNHVAFVFGRWPAVLVEEVCNEKVASIVEVFVVIG
jgi:hypothetical protein